jgi:hypothetical protein
MPLAFAAMFLSPNEIGKVVHSLNAMAATQDQEGRAAVWIFFNLDYDSDGVTWVSIFLLRFHRFCLRGHE